MYHYCRACCGFHMVSPRVSHAAATAQRDKCSPWMIGVTRTEHVRQVAPQAPNRGPTHPHHHQHATQTNTPTQTHTSAPAPVAAIHMMICAPMSYACIRLHSAGILDYGTTRTASSIGAKSCNRANTHVRTDGQHGSGPSSIQ